MQVGLGSHQRHESAVGRQGLVQDGLGFLEAAQGHEPFDAGDPGRDGDGVPFADPGKEAQLVVGVRGGEFESCCEEVERVAIGLFGEEKPERADAGNVGNDLTVSDGYCSICRKPYERCGC